ncbi:N-acetyltransferase family protein [Promicromonospora sp. NFX87]|uniref:GNAT family N-acetyltransferase n=1 Tax=Promicromonospora sp. NFX87 TaxID=3402691 RepID=UPI003AFA93A0
MTEPRVRPAILDDAEAIAAAHHSAWVQTYSGLLPAEHWERDTVARRRERWRDRLSREAPGHPLVAVVDERVVGFAQSGSTRSKGGIPAVRPDELWSLYVLPEQHGTGIGVLLLNAVLLPDSLAELWVAEANPRARRFYEKHGFVPDGARFTDDLEIAEIRMVRARDEAASPP